MAEYRGVSPEGVMHIKATEQYMGKSGHLCGTCQREDRFMWIKAQREEASDLECPICDSMMTVPRGTEQMP